jgi:hypothetical protein
MPASATKTTVMPGAAKFVTKCSISPSIQLMDRRRLLAKARWSFDTRKQGEGTLGRTREFSRRSPHIGKMM